MQFLVNVRKQCKPINKTLYYFAYRSVRNSYKIGNFIRYNVIYVNELVKSRGSYGEKNNCFETKWVASFLYVWNNHILANNR